MGISTRTIAGESADSSRRRSGIFFATGFDTVKVLRQSGILLGCWCGVGRVRANVITIWEVSTLSCPRRSPIHSPRGLIGARHRSSKPADAGSSPAGGSKS